MAMINAYNIASEMVKDRLKDIDPEAYEKIQDVGAADIVIVPGQYDHIENVLAKAGTPFAHVGGGQLGATELRPDQIVFVNCPGNIAPQGLRTLERFVQAGGFLFTTDWALKHVLEKAFPGFVRFNDRTTADEVVRVEILDTEDPFLKSLLGPQDDPQWWLEGSSYPIQILASDKVKVLLKSKAIEEKYGESPVFITFPYGKGRIYHMISHFYLQRSETRNARQKGTVEDYLTEKNISEEQKAKYRNMVTNDENLGEVESAFASLAMLNKVIFDKKSQKSESQADEPGK